MKPGTVVPVAADEAYFGAPPVSPVCVTALPGCVLVNVPVDPEADLSGYISRHVELQNLTDEEGKVLRRIESALTKSLTRNRNGRVICTMPDALRYVLEQVRKAVTQ